MTACPLFGLDSYSKLLNKKIISLSRYNFLAFVCTCFEKGLSNCYKYYHIVPWLERQRSGTKIKGNWRNRTDMINYMHTPVTSVFSLLYCYWK